MKKKTVKEAILELVKPGKMYRWQDIYNLLKTEYLPNTISWGKSKLVEEGILEEFVENGVKYIRLKQNKQKFYSFNEMDVYDYLETIKDRIVEYFKEEYYNEIIMDEERIEFDLDKFYKDCVLLGIDVELFDWIINEPLEALKYFKECYDEAYYILKNESRKIIFIFKNLPEFYKTVGKRPFTIRDVNSKYIGKLVEFEGIVTIATSIQAMLKVGVYVCPKCGQKYKIEYDNIFTEFKIPKCNSCECECSFIEDESEFIDVQEIKLQQPLDLLENPEEPPRQITIIYENTPGVYAGRVRVVGIPMIIKKKKKKLHHNIYIKALNVEVLDNNVHVNLTNDDIEKIEKIAKRKDVIELLSNKLFSRIKGHDLIKKAIFLQQIKGIQVEGYRHNIHILLITDPGVGKTVMLKRIAKIPGNEYVSMTTATGVGLTAAVVRERIEIGGDSWVLKPGVLVRANGGTACIDEINVKKDGIKDILEAMEGQTIHVSKGGITAKLPAECAVLAACNPKRGRFDRNQSIIEQIDIPAPLLSRFDLIFPLMDEPDECKDAEIITHILDGLNKKIKGDEGKLEVDGVVIDDEFIYKYIYYARQKKPVFSEKAKELFIKYYVEMRKLGKGDRPIPITARQAEAIMRIAGAVAKARLKDVVDENDVKEAIELMNYCLSQIAYDPETGYDIDKILVGISKKERDKLTTIYNVIKKLSEKSELVEYDDIVEEAKSMGLNEEDIELIIEKLKRYGDIDEPRPGKYRLL